MPRPVSPGPLLLPSSVRARGRRALFTLVLRVCVSSQALCLLCPHLTSLRLTHSSPYLPTGSSFTLGLTQVPLPGFPCPSADPAGQAAGNVAWGRVGRGLETVSPCAETAGRG